MRKPPKKQNPGKQRALALGLLVCLAFAWWAVFWESSEPSYVADGMVRTADADSSPMDPRPSSEEVALQAGRVLEGARTSNVHIVADVVSDQPIDETVRVSLPIRLLDLVSREPLPAFALRAHTLEPNFRDTTGETDRNGLVIFAGAPTLQDLQLALVDHPGIQRENGEERWRVCVGCEGKPPEGESFPEMLQTVEIAVWIGATYFFKVELPEGYTNQDVEAYLLTRPPGSDVSGFDAVLREPHPETLYPDLPWVRLGGDSTIPSPAWIELRTSDGHFRGGTWTTQTQGVCRQPLTVGLVQSTSLEGRFDWSGAPGQMNHVIELKEEPLDEIDRAPNAYRTQVESSGEFAFEPLEPGNYQLIVRDPAWYPESFPIQVRQGSNDIGQVKLRPRPVAGAISGQVTSKSGLYTGDCTINLNEMAFAPAPQFSQKLVFRDNGSGQLVAPFQIENVTVGPWQLYLASNDSFDWKFVQVVQAPASDLHIVLDDDRVGIEVRFVDAESGEELQEGLFWGFTIGSHRQWGSTNPLRIDSIANDPDRFRLEVFADGYQPSHGSAAIFLREVDSNGTPELHSARVLMRRGWGAKVTVVSDVSNEPIVNAVVRIDGVAAGKTDREGTFWATAAQCPLVVQVEKPGWRVVSPDPEASGVPLDLSFNFLEFSMVRADDR